MTLAERRAFGHREGAGVFVDQGAGTIAEHTRAQDLLAELDEIVGSGHRDEEHAVIMQHPGALVGVMAAIERDDQVDAAVAYW